jgi:hypothetical protein
LLSFKTVADTFVPLRFRLFDIESLLARSGPLRLS